MSKRKSEYRDLRASKDTNDKYFGRLYAGMMTSRAYKNLSLGAKQFYVLCRVQAMSKNGKACLYKHASEYGLKYNEYCFVFPAAHLAKYGMDRSNAHRYFKELEEAGFITMRENNKFQKRVNVYEFSDAWKR